MLLEICMYFIIFMGVLWERAPWGLSSKNKVTAKDCTKRQQNSIKIVEKHFFFWAWTPCRIGNDRTQDAHPHRIKPKCLKIYCRPISSVGHVGYFVLHESYFFNNRINILGPTFFSSPFATWTLGHINYHLLEKNIRKQNDLSLANVCIRFWSK